MRPLAPADAAFVAFIEQAWRRHLQLAVLLTGDRLQAEELLQDSLVKLYERWRRRSRPDDADTYLRRIIANNHISQWKRTRRESLVPQVPDRAGTVPAEALYGPLRDALLALPPRQRAVVVLRHFEDLSEREIAGLLGCSTGTVKSQNARGLAKLRTALRQLEPEQR